MAKAKKVKLEEPVAAVPGVRNRIKQHVKMRAGDLVPHEQNWRTHPAEQSDALMGLYDEVGFARSLLAYELPDGRLKLIDGHLRRDLTPDMVVDVEVLDVSDDEAKLLLAVIDPLSALAACDRPALTALLADVNSGDAGLQAMLSALAAKEGIIPPDFAPVGAETQGRLDEKKKCTCPECGHEFTP